MSEKKPRVVSVEMAKKLVELNYHIEDSKYHYTPDGELSDGWPNGFSNPPCLPAPTIDEVAKWLSVEHDIRITPKANTSGEGYRQVDIISERLCIGQSFHPDNTMDREAAMEQTIVHILETYHDDIKANWIGRKTSK